MKTLTFQQVIEKIENLIQNASSFKIGKTSLTLEYLQNRYKEEYEYVQIIGHEDNPSVIDLYEKKLIYYFQNQSPYKNNCKNKQLGGGEGEKADKIYVVYNKKKPALKKYTP